MWKLVRDFFRENFGLTSLIYVCCLFVVVFRIAKTTAQENKLLFNSSFENTNIEFTEILKYIEYLFVTKCFRYFSSIQWRVHVTASIIETLLILPYYHRFHFILCWTYSTPIDTYFNVIISNFIFGRVVSKNSTKFELKSNANNFGT